MDYAVFEEVMRRMTQAVQGESREAVALDYGTPFDADPGKGFLHAEAQVPAAVVFTNSQAQVTFPTGVILNLPWGDLCELDGQTDDDVFVLTYNDLYVQINFTRR